MYYIILYPAHSLRGEQGHDTVCAALRAAGAELGIDDSALVTVGCILCTVTFHANHAHNLTRSP